MTNKIAGYVWKLQDSSSDFVSKIIKSVFPEAELEIIELISYPVGKIPPGVLHICFGKRAANIVAGSLESGEQLLELPVLSELEDKPNNQQIRLDSYNKLLEFKNNLQLKEEKELQLSTEDIRLAYKNISNKLCLDTNQYWIGTTVLGKKILITNKNIDIPCNFKLSWEELIAAQAAVDVLGIKSLTIVKGKKDD